MAQTHICSESITSNIPEGLQMKIKNQLLYNMYLPAFYNLSSILTLVENLYNEEEGSKQLLN